MLKLLPIDGVFTPVAGFTTPPVVGTVAVGVVFTLVVVFDGVVDPVTGLVVEVAGLVVVPAAGAGAAAAAAGCALKFAPPLDTLEFIAGAVAAVPPFSELIIPRPDSIKFMSAEMVSATRPGAMFWFAIVAEMPFIMEVNMLDALEFDAISSLYCP